MDPNFIPALCFRAASCLALGMYDKALADERKALAIGGPTPLPLDLLGSTLAATGDREGAEETLAKLRELAKERYISEFFFTHTYMRLGDYDRTLDALETACNERFHRVVTIKVDVTYLPLAANPRFQALLKRMGLDKRPQRVKKKAAP